MRRLLDPLLRKSHIHLEKSISDGINEGIDEYYEIVRTSSNDLPDMNSPVDISIDSDYNRNILNLSPIRKQ